MLYRLEELCSAHRICPERCPVAFIPGIVRLIFLVMNHEAPSRAIPL
jgi:hypothetical protein